MNRRHAVRRCTVVSKGGGNPSMKCCRHIILAWTWNTLRNVTPESNGHAASLYAMREKMYLQNKFLHFRSRYTIGNSLRVHFALCLNYPAAMNDLATSLIRTFALAFPPILRQLCTIPYSWVGHNCSGFIARSDITLLRSSLAHLKTHVHYFTN